MFKAETTAQIAAALVKLAGDGSSVSTSGSVKAQFEDPPKNGFLGRGAERGAGRSENRIRGFFARAGRSRGEGSLRDAPKCGDRGTGNEAVVE